MFLVVVGPVPGRGPAPLFFRLRGRHSTISGALKIVHNGIEELHFKGLTGNVTFRGYNPLELLKPFQSSSEVC